MGQGGHNKGKGDCVMWLRNHAFYDGSNCLIWPFTRNTKGYGYLGFEGKVIRAHRFMCTLFRGLPPSPKHEAAHSCGNGHKGCVNPHHLHWKTRIENERDKLLHGTNAWANRPKRLKLTVAQVAKIRALKGKKSHSYLSKKFGVSENTISDVLNFKSWKDGTPGRTGFAPGDPRNHGRRKRAHFPVAGE